MDTVMCCPDPPSGMDLIPPSGNAFVWWLSAVSPYQKLSLGEDSCLVQVHVPFPEQFTSNNWFIWKHRPKLLILTWDNSEGPAYLQSSLWDQVKVLLRLNCRPFSPSVNMPSSFLSHVLSQERSLMNFLHANLHFSIFFLRNTIFNSHAQSGVV